MEKTNSTIHICTDSLRVLTNLQYCSFDIRTNPFILEIKKNYLKFLEENNCNKKIKFFWISSHQFAENKKHITEILDRKARCYDSDNNGCTIPFIDLRESLKESMYSETNECIIKMSETKAKVYFKEYYRHTSRPWFYKYRMARDLIVFINRLRANHYHLAVSPSRVNIINNSKCKCDEFDEDIDHVVWQCELYKQDRQTLIQQLSRIKLQLHLLIKNVFTSCQTKCKCVQTCPRILEKM